MNITKIFAVLLVFATVSFANLGFKEGDNEFGTGFLAGWGYGDGYGVPFVWDRGAFGGMMSFGAELRMWWAGYHRRGYNEWDELERRIMWLPTDPTIKYTKFGWSPAFRTAFHPFGLSSLKGQVKAARLLDPYAGVKLGFSLIHLDKGDPEVNAKNDTDRTDFSIAWTWWMTGLRFYISENVSLWTEMARYDFSIGFSFKF